MQPTTDIVADQRRELDPPGAWVNCRYCGEPAHRDDVVIKVIHTGRGTEQFAYCSTTCHHHHYLARLRSWGM